VYEDQLLAGVFRVSSALIDALGRTDGPAMALRLGRDHGVMELMLVWLLPCLFLAPPTHRCVEGSLPVWQLTRFGLQVRATGHS
jgi:hypothetical protein